MKTWAEMTERERDALVARALGWEVIEVAEATSFKRVIESGWYDVTTTRPPSALDSLGWLRRGNIHWTREGHKIQMGSIERSGKKEYIKLWTIPHFSTDRATAMTLLDEFEEWTVNKIQGLDRVYFKCNVPLASINMLDDTEKYDWIRGNTFIAKFGTTEAEAICRAFLRAKGINIE